MIKICLDCYKLFIIITTHAKELKKLLEIISQCIFKLIKRQSSQVLMRTQNHNRVKLIFSLTFDNA